MNPDRLPRFPAVTPVAVQNDVVLEFFFIFYFFLLLLSLFFFVSLISQMSERPQPKHTETKMHGERL